MLVRSPSLTNNSHKWRELVSSGRLVCRCHDVFLSCYVCSVLLCFVFRLHAFVEAAALRSIALRYAGAPIATRVYFILFYFPFIYLEMSLFRVFSCPPSFCMESTSYVLSFRMVFFYLVTTGWIFDISLLCENSINSIKKCTRYIPVRRVHTSYTSIHYLSVNKQCAYMAPKCTSHSTKSCKSKKYGTFKKNKRMKNPLKNQD